MLCRKCKKSIDDAAPKIGFRDSCPHCGTDLHTCTNCKYYAIGKPNDCLVPGTEYVKDRDANNFCEDFRLKIDSPKTNDENNKKKFNSLFKDD